MCLNRVCGALVVVLVGLLASAFNSLLFCISVRCRRGLLALAAFISHVRIVANGSSFLTLLCLCVSAGVWFGEDHGPGSLKVSSAGGIEEGREREEEKLKAFEFKVVLERVTDWMTTGRAL